MRILVLFFLLFFGINTFSQNYFRRVIGGLGEDYGNTVVLTDDNGFLIGGSSSSYNISNSDAIIFKLDSVGNTQWFKTYGGSQQESAKYMIKDFDGNFVFTGYTSSFGNGSYDVYLVKINSNGDTLFTKTFGGSDWEEGNHIIQLQDSSYIISGYTFSYGAGAKDAYLLKVSKEGNLIWSKTFGYQNNEEIFETIELKNDTSIICVGFTNSIGNGLNDGWAIKVDDDGNQEWEITSGQAFDDEFKTIAYINNHFSILGNTRSYSNDSNWDEILTIIDQSGNISNILVEQLNLDDYITRMIVGDNEDHVFTGYTNGFGGGKNDMYCKIFTKNFAYINGPTMGEAENEIGRDLKRTNDKGYIIVGNTNSFGDKGYQNIYVVKNDSTNSSPRYSEVITVNIIDLEKNDIKIYPNPFSSYFTIESENLNNESRVELYDFSGKRIIQYSTQYFNNRLLVKSEELENGIYFLRVILNNDKIGFSKLILNK